MHIDEHNACAKTKVKRVDRRMIGVCRHVMWCLHGRTVRRMVRLTVQRTQRRTASKATDAFMRSRDIDVS
jgi:hypothetical protein